MVEYNPYQQMHHVTFYSRTRKVSSPKKRPAPVAQYELLYNGQSTGCKAPWGICASKEAALKATGNYKLGIFTKRKL